MAPVGGAPRIVHAAPSFLICLLCLFFFFVLCLWRGRILGSASAARNWPPCSNPSASQFRTPSSLRGGIGSSRHAVAVDLGGAVSIEH